MKILFLEELREKLNEAESYKNEKTRNEKLMEFQNYISTLQFLNPACGSGNFLTRLENEALEVMSGWKNDVRYKGHYKGIYSTILWNRNK